ncbi:sigma-70 family RNA polymerase sigma factor [Sphingobacterium sp. DK4209]|uniref:Sigma-70 family RNA polymerase sigma factor n=2 Tax=Sphingobacterium zhuxiongii TaxID=2662364 RepID=A0A5Q0QEY4_9SPHI|nr:sigma-70 family RNA polymerase sigma factor [Sphingobacterium sp. DK4209]QGA26112.1 sigma-70 family RNA polymerase sigma factor [Sphingobacterium sp. dk4302]
MSNSEKSKAFLYKKFYGYVMTIVFRYMKHEMEAEELTNECFVKVFSKINSFSIHDDEVILEKTFKAWIGRIAVNTSIDALRVRKQMYMLDDLNGSDTLHFSVEADNRLEYNDIIALIRELPDIQRSIFNMYEIEGFSHEEISKELGIPESTSRTYLTRAKQKLRKLYASQINLERIQS